MHVMKFPSCALQISLTGAIHRELYTVLQEWGADKSKSCKSDSTEERQALSSVNCRLTKLKVTTTFEPVL